MHDNKMDLDENAMRHGQSSPPFGERWRIPFGTAYTAWLHRLLARRDPKHRQKRCSEDIVMNETSRWWDDWLGRWVVDWEIEKLGVRISNCKRPRQDC